MEWQQCLEYIHCSVRKDDVKPKERTEKGFMEWIIDRGDVQEKIDTWFKSLRNANNQSVKDSEKAKKFKEEGNLHFKKKNYPESVESYTQSAKYAPFGSDCYAVAIGNRSASFFHMCRYKESLQDIDLAINCGYPGELLWKLYLRASQCHLKLRQGELAVKSLTSLKAVVEDSSELKTSVRDTILLQAEELSCAASESQKRYESFPGPSTEQTEQSVENLLPKNSTFPFASQDVILKHSPSKGRHVVAGKSIKKGDVLFVEKPFAWVPVTHGNNVTLCAHCCGPLNDALVPCRGCLDALYCSKTCWEDGLAYHKFECEGYHVRLWQQIGISHLAFKIFVISLTTSDKTGFNDVQKLITNVEKRSIDDVFGIAIGSLMVTTYLEQFTNFFDVVDLNCIVNITDPSLSFDFDLSTKKGKKLYVGSMILRHSLQMVANAYAVTRLVEVEPSENEIMVENQVRIAAGAFPSAAMMNHSCDPSVIHTFWKNWLIVKAVKDIPEGEEIFNNYGPYFKRMPKAQRQKDLENQYCFHCKCSACTNPLFDHYTDRFDGLKCLKCYGSALKSPGKMNQRCLDCGETSKVTCTAALEEAAALSDRGMYFTEIDKWEEAIPCFEKSRAIREKHMYKYNEDLAVTLDALGKSYASTGQWLKSIYYLERSLAAIEERYGADSIEVANELNKITDVCLQYLRRTMSRRSSEFREAYMKTKKYVDRAMKIFSLTGTPLNDKYQEMNNKKEELSGMKEQRI